MPDFSAAIILGGCYCGCKIITLPWRATRKWAYDFTSSKPIKGILAAFNAARPLAVGAA
jgi:hypothetical protein